jgi:endonuclease YncB( thermonuclease family)
VGKTVGYTCGAHLVHCGAIGFQSVHAETLLGLVVGVSDGDTVTVLDGSKTIHKIRLSGIDAPEGGQAFGQVSKRYLSDLIYKKEVAVEWTKYDRYQRKIGKIIYQNQDVCLAQVKAGMAWHFKKYQRDQEPADRGIYAEAEIQAREAKRSLWRDKDPQAPWDWRAEKKRKQAESED